MTALPWPDGLSVGANPVLRQLLAQLRRGVEIQISPASRAV